MQKTNRNEAGYRVSTTIKAAVRGNHRVVLPAPWLNPRNFFQYDETLGVLESTIKATLNNNKETKRLQRAILKENCYKSKTTASPIAIDAVDACKCYKHQQSAIRAYKQQGWNKVVDFHKEVIDIILSAKSIQDMEEKLAPYRGRYYVLLGGYTRYSILCNDYLNNKDDRVSAEMSGNTFFDFVVKELADDFSKNPFNRNVKDFSNYEFGRYYDIVVIAKAFEDNSTIGKAKSQERAAFCRSFSYYWRLVVDYEKEFHTDATFDEIWASSVGAIIERSTGLKKDNTAKALIYDLARKFATDVPGVAEDTYASFAERTLKRFYVNEGRVSFLSNDLTSVVNEKEFRDLLRRFMDVRTSYVGATALNADTFASDLMVKADNVNTSKIWTYEEIAELTAAVKADYENGKDLKTPLEKQVIELNARIRDLENSVAEKQSEIDELLERFAKINSLLGRN